MANQIFDIDRFGLYFRKYVTENRRMLGIYALELLLIPAAVLCFSIWLSDPYSRINVLMRYGSDFFSDFDLAWGTERSLFTALFGLFAAIGASLFYNVLSKKNSRIVLFNTPASNLEKSVTYFLIYIIGVILLFFAGSILADYVRIPLCRYLAPEGTFIKPFPLKAIFIGLSLGGMSTGYAASATFFGQLWAYLLFCSFFLLFSSVWPHKSFLKTVLLFIVMIMALILVGYCGFRLFYNAPVTLRDVEASYDVTMWVATAVVVIVSAAFTVTAYFRFKEWDVV